MGDGIGVICAECKREVAEGTKTCPVCGAPVSIQPSATSEPPTALADEAGAWYAYSSMAANQALADAPTWDGPAAARSSRRGLLVAALVALGALVAAILVASLANSSPQRRPSAQTRQLTEQQLRPGDCLTGSKLGLGTNSLPYTVTAVPCNQPHLAEIFFTGNLWPASLATYPGDLTVSSVGEGQCALLLPAYAGDSAAAVTYDWITPFGSSDWASGDREVVCVAYEQGVWLRNSLKVSRR
jgi:hypothetical protein